jgi:hypothetical protein
MWRGKAGQHPASCLHLHLNFLQHCYSAITIERVSSWQILAEGFERICNTCQLLLHILWLIPQSGQLLHSACCSQPLHNIKQAGLQLLQGVGKGVSVTEPLEVLPAGRLRSGLQGVLPLLQTHTASAAEAAQQRKPWQCCRACTAAGRTAAAAGVGVGCTTT